MKIAIVDDMHRDRICLASYIKKYFSTRNVPYEIVEFSSGEEFLDHFVKDAYDLVFMDIYMKQKNGMEAAKEVYQKDPKVSIVFQSTSDEFGVASYAVHALYYLLKPYSEEEFIQAMDKYQKQKGFEEPVLEIVSERVDIHLLFGYDKEKNCDTYKGLRVFDFLYFCRDIGDVVERPALFDVPPGRFSKYGND